MNSARSLKSVAPFQALRKSLWVVLPMLCMALAGCVTTIDIAQGDSTQSQPRQSEALMFSATGDGPRAEEDWGLLRRYFTLEKDDGRSAFLLHVGDICTGSMSPPETYYIQVAQLFATSPIPVIFVPGDNEWTDHDDPEAGWTYWARHFMGFEQQFDGAPRVQWQAKRLENIAWNARGVLMIGVALVGGRPDPPDQWAERHEQNAQWVHDNLVKYRDAVRAAVVFAHAHPAEVHEDFFARFVEDAKVFGKPVLYLHGDGHKWEYKPAWRAPNILRVQVDQVAKAPPVLVTVTHDPAAPFVFDRRLIE